MTHHAPQIAEIFKEDYGMFVYNAETRTFWFNSSSLESGVEFQLVGIVLGGWRVGGGGAAGFRAAGFRAGRVEGRGEETA